MMQPSIKPADEHSAGDIIARIGSLTRMLRDSLRELGLEGHCRSGGSHPRCARSFVLCCADDRPGCGAGAEQC